MRIVKCPLDDVRHGRSRQASDEPLSNVNSTTCEKAGRWHCKFSRLFPATNHMIPSHAFSVVPNVKEGCVNDVLEHHDDMYNIVSNLGI